MNNPLCIALDSTEADRVRALAEQTSPFAEIFKVGVTAYAAAGPGLVEELSSRRPVFLDTKLHDIPSQVEGAVEGIRRMNARYTTVHATGGSEMMKAAVAAAGEGLEILAVTVLTSMDDSTLDEIGVRGPSSDAVERLAELALEVGVRGLVCSPREVARLRGRFGRRDEGGPLLVVPGIRTPASDGDDQRRTLGPREAVDAGADVLVIGRPITGAADPGAAARSFLQEVGFDQPQ